MELAIYFPDAARLEALDEALQPIDPGRIPSHLQAVIFGADAGSNEYYANLAALTQLHPVIADGKAFSRLYFGQEFCEYLIPPLAEVQQAFFVAKQLGWDFTYVTGTVTETGLAEVRRNLSHLATLGHRGEVVINDWGVLRLLNRDFPAMKPVLGRLLTKQKRLVRFNDPETPPPTLMNDIHTPAQTIRENQLAAYRDTALANPLYLEFLDHLGITAIDVDIAPQGLQLPDAGLPLPLGIYYPWGYAASGRNCPTAGLVDRRRAFVALDGPCPRPCKKLNMSQELDHYPHLTLQRGNGLFVFHGDYATPYLDGSIPCSRLVFEPYIPL